MSLHWLFFNVLKFKFKESSTAQHDVFCKRHTVRDEVCEKPADRTLFLINVPPYCDEACLKTVFNKCGTVKSVFFHNKPTSTVPPSEESPFFVTNHPIKGYKVAYVIFEKASGLEKALKLKSTHPIVLSTKENPIPTGVAKWFQEYNETIPDVDALQNDINTYMMSYDNAIKNKARREKDEQEEADGWTVVTKGGRVKSFPRKESVAKKIMAKEEKKRSKKELNNFYTFQIRETKMKNLANLRHKFEEDKKKINTLKKSRRFKPF